MDYTVWISACLSLAPTVLAVVDKNELLDLDLDDLDDLADALGEPVLDFFLDFLGGFGMSGYGVASWLGFSGKMPKGDISRGSSKSVKKKKEKNLANQWQT